MHARVENVIAGFFVIWNNMLLNLLLVYKKGCATFCHINIEYSNEHKVQRNKINHHPPPNIGIYTLLASEVNLHMTAEML